MLYWCRGGTQSPSPPVAYPPARALSRQSPICHVLTDLGILTEGLSCSDLQAEGSHLQLERARPLPDLEPVQESSPEEDLDLLSSDSGLWLEEEESQPSSPESHAYCVNLLFRHGYVENANRVLRAACKVTPHTEVIVASSSQQACPHSRTITQGQSLCNKGPVPNVHWQKPCTAVPGMLLKEAHVTSLVVNVSTMCVCEYSFVDLRWPRPPLQRPVVCLAQGFHGLAMPDVLELNVWLTRTQGEVEPDISISDAWDKISELPKDPRMLHGVKDVCAPTSK